MGKKNQNSPELYKLKVEVHLSALLYPQCLGVFLDFSLNTCKYIHMCVCICTYIYVGDSMSLWFWGLIFTKMGSQCSLYLLKYVWAAGGRDSGAICLPPLPLRLAPWAGSVWPHDRGELSGVASRIWPCSRGMANGTKNIWFSNISHAAKSQVLVFQGPTQASIRPTLTSQEGTCEWIRDMWFSWKCQWFECSEIGMKLPSG